MNADILATILAQLREQLSITQTHTNTDAVIHAIHSQSPSLFDNDSFLFLFLRASRFDPKDTADAIRIHFKKKLELFGLEPLLSSHISVNMMTADNRANLLPSRSIVLLPEGDIQGRPVFVFRYEIIERSVVASEEEYTNTLRGLWLIMMSTVIVETGTRVVEKDKGVVWISVESDHLPGLEEQPFISELASCLRGLPVHIAGLHFCRYRTKTVEAPGATRDLHDDLTKSLVVWAMNKHSSTPIQTHYGTPSTWIRNLEEAGIPAASIEVLLMEGKNPAHSMRTNIDNNDCRKESRGGDGSFPGHSWVTTAGLDRKRGASTSNGKKAESTRLLKGPRRREDEHIFTVERMEARNSQELLDELKSAERAVVRSDPAAASRSYQYSTISSTHHVPAQRSQMLRYMQANDVVGGAKARSIGHEEHQTEIASSLLAVLLPQLLSSQPRLPSPPLLDATMLSQELLLSLAANLLRRVQHSPTSTTAGLLSETSMLVSAALGDNQHFQSVFPASVLSPECMVTLLEKTGSTSRTSIGSQQPAQLLILQQLGALLQQLQANQARQQSPTTQEQQLASIGRSNQGLDQDQDQDQEEHNPVKNLPRPAPNESTRSNGTKEQPSPSTKFLASQTAQELPTQNNNEEATGRPPRKKNYKPVQQQRSTPRLSLILYTQKDDYSGLSEYQRLVRQQIEIFEAAQDDVQFNISKMSKTIVLGQVGIRCRYCASSLPQYSRPKAAVYYPRTLDSLYQSGQNMVKNHLCSTCELIPPAIKNKLQSLQEERRRGKGGRERWAQAAREMSIAEDKHGLRFLIAPAGAEDSGGGGISSRRVAPPERYH